MSSDDEDLWSEEDEDQSIVICNGSSMIHAGFGGDDAPRAVFPTLVGKPKHQGVSIGMGQKDTYVGDEAQSKRGRLTLSCPIENGIITDFDAMEKIWHHTFYNELRVAPDEHSVFLSAKPHCHHFMLEKMTEIMFEEFSTPSCFIASDSMMMMTATGRETGLAVDMGEHATSVTAVHQYHSLPYSMQFNRIGGDQLTNYFQKLMNERGYSFTTSAEREIIRDMKEKLCYVALNFDEEMTTATESSALEINYELPDGQVVTIGNERFRGAEPILNPKVMGVKAPGVVKLIAQAVKKVGDEEIRRDLLGNIVLAGGNSMFAGIADRIAADLKGEYPDTKIKVIAAPERKYSGWIGGSIYSSLSFYEDVKITKLEYEENGPMVARRKCVF